MMEGLMDGAQGGGGGLAPLAAAVENAAADEGIENLGLLRVRVEAEAIAGEGYGVHDVA